MSCLDNGVHYRIRVAGGHASASRSQASALAGHEMKPHLLMVGIVLFMQGYAVAESTNDKHSILEGFKEYSEDVAKACDSISETLKKIEKMHVIQADGFVQDHKTGRMTIGCMAYVTSNIFDNQRGVFPHDTLRKKMEADTWREDLTRAGDGPSSTTYSLYRDEAMCTISAMWGAAISAKTSTAPKTQYELEARCMEMPADKAL